ncbi:uncharacterized protein [Chelonus insularis]|uniref:uncharacterized protein isoform X2 n=1 Tax=Chelonus insularis TaxID=460826 RepID=UPI00158DFB39|nr:uncharacterized protein LOC118065846 isoform X2 [Chelonus insularis]
MLQAVRLLTELARPVDYRRESEPTMDRQTSLGENTIMFREIYKNGWLRKTAKSEKEASRFWVAFCVHNDTEPHLEGFTDQKQSTTHSPVWAHSLRNIQHLSPTLCATSRHDYEFCINFNDDRVLRLAAPSYQTMLEWVQVITRKLTDMKILSPKENVYSKGPERIATRDPTSPLPPPPLPSGSSRPIQQTPSSSEEITREERRPRPNHLQNIRARSHPTSASNSTGTSIPTTSNDSGDLSYDNIFMASSAPLIPSVNPSNCPPVVEQNQNQSERGSSQPVVEPSFEQYAALIECRSSDTPELSHQSRPSQSITPRSSQSGQNHSSGVSSTTNVINTPKLLTLREKQVAQLKREMNHRAGVRLQLGRRDCKDGIAFVDSFGSIWVAGWKYKEHPLLYNVLHVGDMVLSVAGVKPVNAAAIRDILKGITTPRIEVIVRRLPYAKAMILTKRTESEDFGLEVNGNELSGVYGAALNAGLPPLAEAMDPTAPIGSSTTWTLTEMNGRPLNMFDSCASERLRAIGRDISIVVQPTDLIASLRNKLRAMRNYKNFILQ